MSEGTSKVFDLINKEKVRQDASINLIASENYVSENVLKAVGSVFTNKYSEGYPNNRYYGGCGVVDELETYCQEKWKEVFHTDYHVNVQPHSGSQANMAAYMACRLYHGDTVLSMSLDNGGHLTHGSAVNFSGKNYHFIHYGLTKDGFIDYDDISRLIHMHRPKVVLAGASAYSREIDFKRIYNIIQKESEWQEQQVKKWGEGWVGNQYCYIEQSYKPIFMVDMSHIAGLVAAGCHQSPFGLADIITTTTHKTLRGPRGGLIFCKKEFSSAVDKAVFPCIQGGPMLNVIAAKAVAAEEALTKEFNDYIKNVVENAKIMAKVFVDNGFDVVTGGTDNHMFLVDFSNTHPHISGKDVQEYLEYNGVIVNKNCVPNEKRNPLEASGIRIGTPSITTKGYSKEDVIKLAKSICENINILGELRRNNNV